MVMLTYCIACSMGHHERCHEGDTMPGVIGGWRCSCTHDEVPTEACPTPEYHDTHRYCPSCDWREETLHERMGRHGPLVYTKNMGADEPVFHRVVEHDDGILNAVCEPDNRTIHYWGTLHVKHASRIGVACDECFPART